MKKVRKYLLLFILIMFIGSFGGIMCINAETTYPSPTDWKYVNDYGNMLSSDTKEAIVSVGKELEDKTGAQAVVVTVDSLKGEDIETYAHNLFENWHIGQKGKNNGLLIIFSKTDRKWDVEVGTGLEGVISDIYSNKIMKKHFVPNAKEGNYDKGIIYSYSIFANDIAKEYGKTIENNQNIKTPKQNETSNRKSGNKVGGIVVVLLLLDIFLNKGRVSRSLLELAFWNSLFNGRHKGPFDDDDHDHFGGFGGGGSSGGGFGGFGGGSSSGGGSSGGW